MQDFYSRLVLEDMVYINSIMKAVNKQNTVDILKYWSDCISGGATIISQNILGLGSSGKKIHGHQQSGLHCHTCPLL